MQMYETMMTRHSTMLVGPTGGGKTVIITTLVKAQTDLGLPTKLTVLNPKVISIIILNLAFIVSVGYSILAYSSRYWNPKLQKYQ